MMTSLVPQMFNNTCRTCLSTNGEMVDIFSNDIHVNQIPKKLMAFTKVEIINDDLLPKLICKKCIFLADSFYCFKEQCESAEYRLKKCLKTSSQINAKISESERPEEKKNVERSENEDDDYLVEYISDDVKEEVENSVKRRQETERMVTMKKVSDTVKNLSGIQLVPIVNVDDTSNKKSDTERRDEVIVLPVKTARKRHKTRLADDPSPLNKRLRLPYETPVTRVKSDDASLIYGKDKKLNFSTVRKIVKIDDQELAVELKEETVCTDPLDDVKNDDDHQVDDKGTVIHGGMRVKSDAEERNVVEKLEVVESDDDAAQFSIPMKKIVESNRQTEGDHDRLCAKIKGEDLDQSENRSDEEHDPEPTDRVTPLALLRVDSPGKKTRRINLKIYERSDQKTLRDLSPVSVSRRRSGDVNLKYYKCTICALSFASMPAVLKHNVEQHMLQSPYVCLICDKSFDDRSTICEHVEEHNGSKPYRCTFCPKSFTLKRNLKRHVNCHINYKPHQCRVCSKKFSQRSSLKAHSYLHTGDSPFACKICDVSFGSRNNWRRHVATVHEKLTLVSCRHCNEQLPNKSALRVHARVHTGDRPYACPHCDKRFTQQCNLNTHIHCHLNDRPFACPHCGKGFNQRGTRDDHILTHTGERPHKCQECDAGFTVASALKRHMWTHSDRDRPHNCGKCELRFVGLYDLRRHLKLRHGEIVKLENPRVERVVIDKLMDKRKGKYGCRNAEQDSAQAGLPRSSGGKKEITAKENDSLSCNVDKVEEMEDTKVVNLLKEENSISGDDLNDH